MTFRRDVFLHSLLRPICLLRGHRYFSSGRAGATCDRCWAWLDREEYEAWWDEQHRRGKR